MPRGAIHQAEALPQEHSLHVTVSVNQRRTWADFLAAGGCCPHLQACGALGTGRCPCDAMFVVMQCSICII
jgi:hypothetical protein